MKIAIVGAGLAGGACAYALAAAGHEVVVFERSNEPASGASGNDVGMYNPRLFAEMCPEAEYHKAAFELALRSFSSLCHPERARKRAEGSGGETKQQDPFVAVPAPQDDNILGWNPCGALHLITDEKRETRYRKMVQSWGWNEKNLRLVSAAEASEIAGVSLPYDALYIPQSGSISPRKLTKTYLSEIDVRYGQAVENLNDLEADKIILACAHSASAFEECASLPLSKVRGQVSKTTAGDQSKSLRCCLNYGGYTAPAMDGLHTIGASFQRWLTHTDLLPEDDADNIAKLESVVPGITEGMEAVSARASLRTTAPDHFPVVGALTDRIYASLAHGSHGILSSLMAAQILSAMLVGETPALPDATIKKLCPARFA